MKTTYYTLSKWVGPDIDDYKPIKGDFSKNEVLKILSEDSDNTYNYHVTVWVTEWIEGREIDTIEGHINGEEFVLNPDSIFF